MGLHVNKCERRRAALRSISVPGILCLKLVLVAITVSRILDDLDAAVFVLDHEGSLNSGQQPMSQPGSPPLTRTVILLADATPSMSIQPGAASPRTVGPKRLES